MKLSGAQWKVRRNTASGPIPPDTARSDYSTTTLALPKPAICQCLESMPVMRLI